ncbi:MAG: hypothetical protein DLM59_01425 [Pseudonocardiales bacterium]|nr:MAG: hypothetical protein DLM59_01425 [Pseudonocardiales bacterium]
MTATRQVVLIRGINVGGHAKLAMADLRRLLAGLGYDGVRTHLQSGNAVVTSTKAPATVAKEVEQAIADELAVKPRVLVLARDELADVIAGNPLPEATRNGSRFFVTFLFDKPSNGALDGLEPADYTPDEWRLAGRVVFMHCPDGMRDSRLAKALNEKRLGVVATTRNWNTVTKLLALADEE